MAERAGAEREPGFYWVRYVSTSKWEVAEYKDLPRTWLFCGSEESFKDYEIHEIGPRIPDCQPDETTKGEHNAV